MRGARAPQDAQRIGREAGALAPHQQFQRGSDRARLRRSIGVLKGVGERHINVRDHGQHSPAQQSLRQAGDHGGGSNVDRSAILQDVIRALDGTASAEAGEQKSHGALQLCIGRNVVCAELIVGAGRRLGDPLLGGECTLQPALRRGVGCGVFTPMGTGKDHRRRASGHIAAQDFDQLRLGGFVGHEGTQIELPPRAEQI